MLNLRKFIEYVNPEESNFLYVTTLCAMSKWLKGEDFSVEQRQLLGYLKSYDLAPLLNQDSDKDQLDAFKAQLSQSSESGIGFAIAPYLFIWNIRRFDKFSEFAHFNVVTYFSKLNEFFNDNRSHLTSFQDNHLRFNPVPLDDVNDLYKLLNSQLKSIGIDQNEFVGVMKLTHLINPYAFPIIDNDIAKGMKLVDGNRDYLSIEKCVQWHGIVSACISDFDESEVVDFEQQNISLVRALDLAMMHYRIDPKPYSKASRKNKSHICSLGFKI